MTEHKANKKDWMIVYREDDMVVLSTSCACGDDAGCAWTLTVYDVQAKATRVGE